MENTYSSKQLFVKLSYLHWLLERKMWSSSRRYGVVAQAAKGQGRVLALLKRMPEVSTAELAYLLDMRQQSLNELLIKLEKSGYIARERSEEDKRVLLVKITEKGKAVKQEESDYSSVFESLTPEEQNRFGDYLVRVIADLEKRLNAEDERLPRRMGRDWSDFTEEEFSRMMDERGQMRHRR